jgi:hypothetical protein
MKARHVYENLDFERGQDPKDALGIGLRREIKEKLARIMREEELTGISYVEQEGIPKLLLRGPGDVFGFMFRKALDVYGLRKYLNYPKYKERPKLTSPNDEDKFLYYAIKPEYKELFSGIDLYWRNLDENLYFQKYGDPKTSLGIGTTEMIKRGLENLADMGIQRAWLVYDEKYNKTSLELHHNYFRSKEMIPLVMEELGKFLYPKKRMTPGTSGIGVDWFRIKPEYVEVFERVLHHKKLSEGLDFERGQDPIKSLKLSGKLEIWDRFLKLRGGYINYPVLYHSIWEEDGTIRIYGEGLKFKTNTNLLLTEKGLDKYIDLPGKIFGRAGLSIEILYPIKDKYKKFLEGFATSNYIGKDSVYESL